MKKRISKSLKDDLRPEYDLRELLKEGARGKYVRRYQEGTNLVMLDHDVAREFHGDKAVNEALRLVIQLTRIANRKGKGSSK